jgi:putative transcriptional regulator
MTREVFLKKLGKRIALLREEAGLSQTELALRCDKDRQSFNRMEKGRTNPTSYTMYLIAKELDIPLSRLFEFDEK